uniref:Uncharacterized protein n=1 Tax=Arundo donax TaxID=35708 RepID=A0A0A8ZHZ8_ARUDO
MPTLSGIPQHVVHRLTLRWQGWFGGSALCSAVELTRKGGHMQSAVNTRSHWL